MSETTPCPLCENSDTLVFCTVNGIAYLRCRDCLLTWMSQENLPDRAEEKRQYDLHENDPGDPDYRRFLARLWEPLRERLPEGSTGLDFGCGPGPALAAMAGEAGFPVALYDPIYFPDKSALDRCHDFITCTEVVEHLHHPATEFHLFDRLLRPGGWLGIMTGWLEDDAGFARWHYRRDPTHVCFYRRETLHWLANHYGWSLWLPARNVALFRKPEDR